MQCNGFPTRHARIHTCKVRLHQARPAAATQPPCHPPRCHVSIIAILSRPPLHHPSPMQLSPMDSKIPYAFTLYKPRGQWAVGTTVILLCSCRRPETKGTPPTHLSPLHPRRALTRHSFRKPAALKPPLRSSSIYSTRISSSCQSLIS